MNSILYIVYWFYCIAAAVGVMFASTYYIDNLKRMGYRAGAYTAWVRARFVKDWLPLMLIGVMCMLLKICNVFFITRFPLLSYICFYGADAAFLYMLYSLYFDYRKTEADPLKAQGPALRVLVVVFLLAFLCEANLMRETRYYGAMNWLQYLLPYLVGYLPAMLIPLLVLLGVCLSAPRQAFAAPDEAAEDGETNEAAAGEETAAAEAAEKENIPEHQEEQGEEK